MHAVVIKPSATAVLSLSLSLTRAPPIPHWFSTQAHGPLIVPLPFLPFLSRRIIVHPFWRLLYLACFSIFRSLSLAFPPRPVLVYFFSFLITRGETGFFSSSNPREREVHTGRVGSAGDSMRFRLVKVCNFGFATVHYIWAVCVYGVRG